MKIPLMLVILFSFLTFPWISGAGQDDLRLRVIPLPSDSREALADMRSRPHISVHKDWFHWCPSVLKAEDGMYHMFHTRWPKSIGFLSWLTHSEIVHAVATSPEGPFRTLEVAMPPTGSERGDWFTAHNSKIKKFEGRYYLYFCQTRGDSFKEAGEKKRIDMARTGYNHVLWKQEARPNQRTFVACSDSLDGPWDVSPEPIIQPAGPITTLTSTPLYAEGQRERIL
jgi:hypothetical protein